jgi:hypothetical protein
MLKGEKCRNESKTTTVKVHRSNMMRKIKAAWVADLCRMVDKLKLLPEASKPS